MKTTTTVTWPMFRLGQNRCLVLDWRSGAAGLRQGNTLAWRLWCSFGLRSCSHACTYCIICLGSCVPTFVCVTALESYGLKVVRRGIHVSMKMHMQILPRCQHWCATPKYLFSVYNMFYVWGGSQPGFGLQAQTSVKPPRKWLVLLIKNNICRITVFRKHRIWLWKPMA